MWKGTVREPVTRRNTDEQRLRLQRLAASGDVGAAARLLSLRVRAGELPERNLRAAALMGVPEAEVALGLEGIRPEEARDRLVLLLDTSDAAYSVLWAWASAHAAVAMTYVSPYKAGCLRLLGLVESWLDDPLSETAQRCRDEAYDVAAIEDDGHDSLMVASAAWAGLSVSPWSIDFPAEHDFRPGPLPSVAARRAVFMLEQTSVRYVLRGMHTSREARGGAPVPAFESGVDPSVSSFIEAMSRQPPYGGIPRLLVRLRTAAAAWAHTFAFWALEPKSPETASVSLDVLAGLVATRVRPWLLGGDLRGSFRWGREILFDPGTEDPTPRCRSCRIMLDRRTDVQSDDAGEIWEIECAACRARSAL